MNSVFDNFTVGSTGSARIEKEAKQQESQANLDTFFSQNETVEIAYLSCGAAAAWHIQTNHCAQLVCDDVSCLLLFTASAAL